MVIFLRVLLSSGVKVYLKISVAAHTFEALKKAGGLMSLMEAIAMGLLTILLAVPPQVTAVGSHFSYGFSFG